MISRFFIGRPVLTSVISIFIILAGITAIFNLPIAQFPEIAPPQIVVEATYPGASAELVEKTVATPLEQEINGTENMLYMNSTSTGNGFMSLVITFEVGTNIDQAAINVSNRVKIAEPKLPQEVRREGIKVQKQSSTIALIATLGSKTDLFNDIELSNYASINVIDEIKRVPGVGNAMIFGAKDYAMRIWIHPDKLSFYKLTVSDVISSINEQNNQYAVGKVGELPATNPSDFILSIKTQSQLVNIEEFGNIILKSNTDGSALKLKDVAKIELGTTDYSTYGNLNGKPVALLAVYPQPNANLINVVADASKKLDELSKNFPPGVVYSIPYNTTNFVKISIKEAIKTLLEAIVLVFLVVYLFLQNWRATFIPCMAVPVSIIGTFGGIYLLGFSINTLTLFGLVLSIGIVIDDAIVVLENVERIIRTEGLNAKDAAIKAMKQVTAPVITIMLVLCAVFVPVAFLGGMTGQLYKQFAITITISVLISGFVALTLTPMLCALILKDSHFSKPHKAFNKFNMYFDKVANFFSQGVNFSIAHSKIMLVIYLCLIVMTYGLYKLNTQSFMPEEDQGFVLASINLPDASSIVRTKKVVEQLEAMIRTHPAVKDIVSYAGFDVLSNSVKTSAATVWVTLIDWDDRKSPDLRVNSIAGFIMHKGSTIKDTFVLAFNMPSIPGLGTIGGFEAYLQNREDTYIKGLDEATHTLVSQAVKLKEVVGLNSSFRANVPQLIMQVDNEKSKSLGIPLNKVYENLGSAFSAIYANDFYKFGKTYKVLVQADSQYRNYAQDLSKIYVRSAEGVIIPVNTIAKIIEGRGAEMIEHFNGFVSSHIYGGSAPGYSSDQSMDSLQNFVSKSLSSNFTLAWAGEAYQAMRAGNASTVALIGGILVIFLILAAQYEQWSLPFSVILSIPFALFGALLAIFIRQIPNDIYFQIGIITLIGLGAKNSILIVEFANIKRKEGVDTLTAVIEATKLRFRPIIMTSMAFIIGVVPLVISSGAGANSRHSIGTGVFGGMLISTLITIVFVPLFYYWIVERKFTK